MSDAVETPAVVTPSAEPSPVQAERVESKDPDLEPAAERLQRAKRVHKAEQEAKAKGPGEPAKDEPAKEEKQVPETDLQAARDARAQRIAALQQSMREKVAKAVAAKKPAQAEDDDHVRVPKTKAAQYSELERAMGDEEAFLTLAEQRGMTSDKLAAWIKQRISNPEVIAERKAKALQAEAGEKWQAEFAKIQAELAELRGREESREAERAEARAAAEFVEFTKQSARVAPLSASFLAKHGEAQYLHIARSLATSLPEGSGAQAVQDAVEAYLEAFQLGAAVPSTSPKPAAAKAEVGPGTVTNSIASSRTALVDDDAFALLPPAERLRIVRQRAE